MQRTNERNKEIHALCGDIAWHLNNRGIPLNEFIRFEIPPDSHDIKRHVFQFLGEKLYGKKHTSDWTEEEAKRIISLVKENVFSKWDIDLYTRQANEDYDK